MQCDNIGLKHHPVLFQGSKISAGKALGSAKRWSQHLQLRLLLARSGEYHHHVPGLSDMAGRTDTRSYFIAMNTSEMMALADFAISCNCAGGTSIVQDFSGGHVLVNVTSGCLM